MLIRLGSDDRFVQGPTRKVFCAPSTKREIHCCFAVPGHIEVHMEQFTKSWRAEIDESPNPDWMKSTGDYGNNYTSY
ncbi:hypothetical protein D918_05435 [Trichuris suis]|nr:hypothetical protein D918_05435 [Trichuris suis]